MAETARLSQPIMSTLRYAIPYPLTGRIALPIVHQPVHEDMLTNIPEKNHREEMMWRKRVVLGAALACALGATNSFSAEDAVFRIGGIVSLSGPYGIIGEGMRRAVQIALDERDNKILGKPIEIQWEDDETKPQVAVQKGTRLLSSHVNLLFGSVASSSTLALMKLSEQRKVPLLVTASGDDRITGVDKTHYTFRTAHNIKAEILTVERYIAATGIKKLYGISADYNVMRDGWTLLRDQVKAHGGEILGEDFPPLGSKDYSILIDKVSNSGAEAVAVELTGSDAVTFVKQAAEVGLTKRVKIIGPNLMDETFAKAAGPAAVGVQSALRYDFSFRNPANDRFVAAYRKKYGEWPNAFDGEAYDGMKWLLDVIDKTGTWDTEIWISAFEKSINEDSVNGTSTMQACNHHAMHQGLFGEAEKGGEDQPPYIMNIKYIFKADEVFVPCN
jgi:ABC-type branched-subunit amino acid transport system substrate-binding protein